MRRCDDCGHPRGEHGPLLGRCLECRCGGFTSRVEDGALIALALIAAIAACTPIAPKPPVSEDPTEYPPSSFGLEAGSGTPCESACARLAALHCPEAKPTKSGVACAELCARTEQRLENLPTTCVAGATSIPAVRACGVRCVE